MSLISLLKSCNLRTFYYLCLDQHSPTGQNIYELVHAGLQYLDTRTDFWRQQKPMYARKRDRVIQRHIGAKDSKTTPNQYIIRELEKIDEGNISVPWFIMSANDDDDNNNNKKNIAKCKAVHFDDDVDDIKSTVEPVMYNLP